MAVVTADVTVIHGARISALQAENMFAIVDKAVDVVSVPTVSKP